MSVIGPNNRDFASKHLTGVSRPLPKRETEKTAETPKDVVLEGPQAGPLIVPSIPAAKTSSIQAATLKRSAEETAVTAASSATGGLFSALPKFWGKVKGLASSIVSGQFGTRRTAAKTVEAVNKLEPAMQALTDTELKQKTTEFRTRLKLGESLDDLMPEAFAVVREGSRRQLGIRHYDVQIEGGVYAHQGGVVEMKTGEGKTYMGMLPVYLNALTGKGAHVLTYNDYLAERDAGKASKVFSALGMDVGFIHSKMSPEERRAANEADITYGSAADFGFQYLNDNLVKRPEDKLGRDLSGVYALLDEADSILLDESGTPLIISDSNQSDEQPTAIFNEVVKHLDEGADFEKDTTKKQSWLTEAGWDRVEGILGMGDLHSPQNEYLLPYLHAAVQVHAVMEKDVDYMVKDGRVMLIDELTGRAKEDHRFTEGIHQAIEAKEGVAIGSSSRKVASITHPNYLRKYGRVAGMTGTAVSAKEDFEGYGLGVIDVHTNLPNKREDKVDRLFPDQASRDAALADEISARQKRGQPVLVGTTSIEKSEELSAKLTSLGIEHQVLNARNPALEAQIVAQAGRPGQVTIATNMAGRGTDIKLGGDPEGLASLEAQQTGASLDELLPKWESHCKDAKGKVLEQGGLVVLGAGRNSSRRIDNQLAGRAGRQGDQGESQFFLAADDPLFVRNLEEPPTFTEEVGGDMAQGWINRAQDRAEGKVRDARNNLMRFDVAANMQREALYAERNTVLSGEDLREEFPELIGRTANAIIDRHYEGSVLKDQRRLRENVGMLTRSGPRDVPEFQSKGEVRKWLTKTFEQKLGERESAFGGEAYADTLAPLYLAATDMAWSAQQENLQHLREGAWMKSYAQQDPFQEYNLEAFQQFQKMLDGVAMNFLAMAIQVPTPEEAQAQIANSVARRVPE